MKTCDLCGAPCEGALCESCDAFHANRGQQFQAAKRAVERVRVEGAAELQRYKDAAMRTLRYDMQAVIDGTPERQALQAARKEAWESGRAEALKAVSFQRAYYFDRSGYTALDACDEIEELIRTLKPGGAS